MAITKKLQACAIVSKEVHSHLVLNAAELLRQHIEIIDHKANRDGTVTVTLAGRGLGRNAIPVPPPINISVENGQIKILPLE